MTLEILTPEENLYSGDIYLVQLPGTEGSFEILDRHAPLVASLGKGIIKVKKTKSEVISYKIESGFVEVLDNKTTVLVEGASGE